MPFVPRSQLEQKQQAAAPPTMPVVEDFQTKQPAPDPRIAHDNTEEQIAELKRTAYPRIGRARRLEEGAPGQRAEEAKASTHRQTKTAI
jgi:hypothetical protein